MWKRNSVNVDEHVLFLDTGNLKLPLFGCQLVSK